jgi:hypothetical protein
MLAALLEKLTAWPRKPSAQNSDQSGLPEDDTGLADTSIKFLS